MTPKQKLILDFIKIYIEIKGFSPAYREIAIGIKLKSAANVHRHVHALRKEGLLELDPHKFRTLKLMDKSVRAIEKL